MAIPLLFLLFSISLAPSHGGAQTTDCSSYKFSNGQTYTTCTNLAHLSASIHWTYESAGTLSLAFVAPPASPSGWIAWGINPVSDGMIGTQALIAFKQSNGSMTVRTYNITSYASIQESPILYKTSDLSSDFGSDGNIRLFAKVQIGKGMDSLNQVYQVGSSVTNDVPNRHALNTDNLSSKGKLVLGVNSGPAMQPAPAPIYGRTFAAAPGAPSSGGAASPAPTTGSSAARTSGTSLFGSVLVLLLAGFMLRF